MCGDIDVHADRGEGKSERGERNGERKGRKEGGRSEGGTEGWRADNTKGTHTALLLMLVRDAKA